ncbi:heme ABC transporter ATP-binding protein [Variovorax sp. J31P207]|uniref:heme ABC transporter ATP-binding protein n=1 Tax=Variovorax sp. J31P207 TaxID=3053510 RepID=UPI0025784DC1|nr:heme ABC transporter ATP-binding protein [Variovorax sp. J31P207]MDM0069231.1 heme ABC transporter ATP-binding protein [Variovorax sp. J31P207]
MTLACTDTDLRLGGKTLLAGADITLQPGRVTAILGPNGAGKSTLLSVLGGQRQPDRGQVLLERQPLAVHRPAALALRRALMPQESAVAFDFSAQDIVALGRFPHRRTPSRDEDAIIDGAMALTDVSALAQRVLNTLSGGEKSRVQMARALAQLWDPRPDGRARWLLLDEPTAALDLSHQHAAMRLLRDWAGQGVGIVAVLHDLNLARRYADEVVVLVGGGGVHQGPAAQVLQPALIERVWGMPCQPVVAADGTIQYLFG